MYAWREIADQPLVVLDAIRRRLPVVAAFSGSTAAWIHGLAVPPCEPVEVTLPAGCGIAARSRLVVRRAELATGEVVMRDGLPTTSAVRTLADLGRRPPLVEAVAVVDEALKKGLLDVDDLSRWADQHAGHRGITLLKMDDQPGGARDRIGHGNALAAHPGLRWPAKAAGPSVAL